MTVMLAPVPLALLGNMLDRDHALIVSRIEHDDALRGAARDADALDPGADELSAVSHQHDLVAALDRKRGDELAGLARDRHRDDAFAAATGGAVLERGRALAHALLGDGEHELLGLRHLDIALFAELEVGACLLVIDRPLLAFLAAPDCARALQVS